MIRETVNIGGKEYEVFPSYEIRKIGYGWWQILCSAWWHDFGGGKTERPIKETTSDSVFIDEVNGADGYDERQMMIHRKFWMDFEERVTDKVGNIVLG